MRKTIKSVDYSRNNPKPFKTEKLWLAVPLATASILAGLAVTTPVNAATNNGNTDVEPATSETDSATKGTNTPATETASTANTNESETTKGDDNSSTNNALSDETTNQSLSNAPESGTVPSESQTINNGITGQTINIVGTNKNNPATSTGANPTTAAPHAIQSADTNDSLSIQAVAESDEITPTESTVPNTADTTTAKTIDHVPNLSNFYVGVNGSYVPYDSMAMVNVLPYSSELWDKPDNSDIGNNLFGFYIVLPSSVTSTLDWMQTGANNYVTALNAQGYVHVNTLTASKLANTSTGRQVYYFRPDDQATILAAGPQTGFFRILKMSVLVHTTADTNVKTVTINAKDDSGKDTYGTGQLPINDVLFAGIGNTTVYPHDTLYEAMPSSTFGNDWPDANVVGIAADNGATQLSFIPIKVADHYDIKYNTAGSTTLHILLPTESTPEMTPGTSYDPSDYKKSFYDTLNKNKNNWWLPSFRYVGATSDIGNLPYNSPTQVFPSSVTVEPTSLDIKDPTQIPGHDYAFIVAHIATKLDTNDSTIEEGTTWSPDDNITFTMPSAEEEKISAMKPSDTIKNDDGSTTYKYTDDDGTMTVTSNVDTNKPGVYTVNYTYLDNQNNKTSTTPVKVTVIPTTDNSILKVNEQSDITASNGTWTYDQGITELKDKSGKDITPAAALADTSDPLTVTITDSSGNTLKNSDGTNATSIDTSKPGKYTITYNYGKLTDSTTLNINPVPSIPTSSTTDETVISGPKMSWNPVAGITLTDASDPTVSAQSALSKGDLSYKVTDSQGNDVTNNTIDSSTPAGNYTVTYSYKGYALPTATTVNVEKPTATLNVVNKTITAGTKWTPFDDINSLTYENSPIDISTGLPAGSSLTATVMGSDGKPVNADTIDYSKAGTYTITYTYTDPVGNPFTAKSTLLITPATSGNSSNTGSGNSSSGNTNDNGNNGGSGSATTDPDNGSENQGNSDYTNTSDNNNNSGSNNDSEPGNTADSDNGAGNTTGDDSNNNGSDSGNTNDSSNDSNTNSNSNSSGNSNTGSETANTNVSNNNDATNSVTPNANISSSNLISNTNKNNNSIMGVNANSGNEVNSNNASNGLITNDTNSTKNTNPQVNTTNGGQLPQTSEKSTTWFTQLGLFLLAIAGAFGFRRKKD